MLHRFSIALFLIVTLSPVIALAQGQPTTPPPPPTGPVASAGDFPAKPGESVITFEKYEIGKAIPTVTEKGVTFTLAGPPRRSRAIGRVMFFQHEFTDRIGILNAMPVEQAIPLQAFFPMGASSVTLVLWGSTSVPAKLEAFDKDRKSVAVAELPAVPNRKSPADPQPSFELTVTATEIVYIHLSGPRDGEFLAAEQVRFLPLPTPPVLPTTTTTKPSN